MVFLKTKNLKLKTLGAFTLIELIVSMTIFTIFVGVITSTFIFTSRALREANEVRKVYGEARFLMDQLTRDVRLNTVDYQCLENELGYETNLFKECESNNVVLLPLISSDGQHRIIYRFEDNQFSILKLDWDEDKWNLALGFTGFETFKMQNVQLETVSFTVVPQDNPYGDGNFSNNKLQFQPSVNIHIEAKSTSSRLAESVPVQLKTTVSSRIYQ